MAVVLEKTVDTNTQHELAVAELSPIARQSSAYASTIDGLEIHDEDQLAMAGDLKKDLNHYRRKLEDKRLSLVKPLKKVTGDIDAMFKAPRDKIDALLGALAKKMNGYVQRQQQIEREARELEAEEERKRAERLRLAAENTREAAADKEDELAEVLDSQAIDAENAADSVLKQKAPPVRGEKSSVSVVKTWVASVFDVKAACLAIAEGRLPADLVTFSQSDLNGMARAIEKECERDGIRFEQKVTAGVR